MPTISCDFTTLLRPLSCVIRASTVSCSLTTMSDSSIIVSINDCIPLCLQALRIACERGPSYRALSNFPILFPVFKLAISAQTFDFGSSNLGSLLLLTFVTIRLQDPWALAVFPICHITTPHTSLCCTTMVAVVTASFIYHECVSHSELTFSVHDHCSEASFKSRFIH